MSTTSRPPCWGIRSEARCWLSPVWVVRRLTWRPKKQHGLRALETATRMHPLGTGEASVRTSVERAVEGALFSIDRAARDLADANPVRQVSRRRARLPARSGDLTVVRPRRSGVPTSVTRMHRVGSRSHRRGWPVSSDRGSLLHVFDAMPRAANVVQLRDAAWRAPQSPPAQHRKSSAAAFACDHHRPTADGESIRRWPTEGRTRVGQHNRINSP